jgi:arylsulfatase A-like enzyme
MTGTLPPAHGVRANNHHGFVLDPEAVTLAERFQEAGFATGAFVSAWPAGPEGGLDQGFETFSGPDSGERPTQETLAEARSWLEQQDGPWLLWVHAYDPHGPYAPSERDLRAVGGGTSDSERYRGEVHQADRLLGPLAREALARDGTVVWTSDHGEVLDEERCGVQHERSSHEVVLRVPLVAAGRGITPGVVDGRVGLSEVSPTLARAWGVADERPGLFESDRPVWVGESGLCDPECASGCSPRGVLGKDRVVHGPDSKLIHRPGTGWLGDRALEPYLEGYAAPTIDPQDRHTEKVRALGYQD